MFAARKVTCKRLEKLTLVGHVVSNNLPRHHDWLNSTFVINGTKEYRARVQSEFYEYLVPGFPIGRVTNPHVGAEVIVFRVPLKSLGRERFVFNIVNAVASYF